MALVHLLFNLTGIIIIYPVPFLRRIPLVLARGLAAQTAKRRWFAFVYMVGVFFVHAAAVRTDRQGPARLLTRRRST